MHGDGVLTVACGGWGCGRSGVREPVVQKGGVILRRAHTGPKVVGQVRRRMTNQSAQLSQSREDRGFVQHRELFTTRLEYQSFEHSCFNLTY